MRKISMFSMCARLPCNILVQSIRPEIIQSADGWLVVKCASTKSIFGCFSWVYIIIIFHRPALFLHRFDLHWTKGHMKSQQFFYDYFVLKCSYGIWNEVHLPLTKLKYVCLFFGNLNVFTESVPFASLLFRPYRFSLLKKPSENSV